jgi:exosortase
MYSKSEDDAHGRLIPFVVLALFWWKRAELLEVPKRHWWPAGLLLAGALGLHTVGHILQQTQICAVAFFVGLYGIMGMVWGPRWLVASFFPFCLFAFCVPLRNVAEGLTFPLRVLATQITSVFSHTILGINVIQDGTRIFDALGQYQYEVAAACSGIRSLTAITALAVIYAFMKFKSPWRRVLVMFSAIPLAVGANVVRLASIIIAAEAFGQDAGNYVHESSWMSLVPYIPAIGGLLLLGWLIREEPRMRTFTPEPALATAD